MVACHDRRGSREGVGFVQHGVGGGDGETADCVRVHHVAEVDHADDLPRPGISAADQDIIIVGIAVNDTHAQPGQDRQDVRRELREKVFDDSTLCGLRNMLEVVANPH